MRKAVKFKWEKEEESALQDLKSHLIKAPILTYPDHSKVFSLARDASDVGIRAVLFQKGKERLMSIAYASRTLNPTERRYSVTERGSLAVIFDLKKFRHTILGFKMQVITDHKPILDLFKKITFTNNQKFNQYFMSILKYSPSFKYIPRRFNTIADRLSRLSEDELANNVTFTAQIVDIDIDRIRIEQDKDECIRNIKANLMIYHNSEKEYTLINDCVYLKPVKNSKCCRFFFSYSRNTSARKSKKLHSHSLAGYSGVQKTCDIVSRNYFWSHCSQQTKEYVLNCETCHLSKGKVMKRAPLESYLSDLFPFLCVSMDTLGPLPTTDNGNKFILVFVDFLSRYTEIAPIKDQTSVSVAETLRHRIITRHSCPQTLLSDVALEFTSDCLISYAIFII